MRNESNYNFYLGRIIAVRPYGLFSGDEILKTITRSAFWDNSLTLDEFNNIIDLCDEMHRILMEDNYNGMWNK